MTRESRFIQLGITFAVIFSLIFPGIVIAASGDLDTTFSGDGKVFTTFLAGKDSRAWDVAVQSDGKIVTVGDTYGGETNMNIGIVRYTKAGVLDKTFNTTGKKTIDLNKSYDQGTGLVIDPDTGKIIIVGQTCPGDGSQCDLVVIRLNPNGSFDTSFNGTGKRVDDFGNGDNGSFGSVAIQEDGKIVVGGYMFNKTTNSYDFAVHRYTTAGKFDLTFNKTGKKSIAFGTGRTDFNSGIAVQEDGKIVVSGRTCDSNGENCDIAIARLTTTGVLDTTFNSTGKVITNLGGSDSASDVSIQDDQKIVVAGAKGGTNTNYAVLRYTSAGKLDTTFAGTGKKVFDFGEDGTEDYARAVIVQADGKILAAGYANGDFALVRLTTVGAFDSTFSTGGKLKVDFGGRDRANGLAIQPADGKYVLAGVNDDGIYHWVVARVLP